MLIKDVIRAERISGAKDRNVVTCPPDAEIIDIAALLAKNRIGLVVIDSGDGGVAGVLSERDIISAIGKHGEGALKMTGRDLMTQNVKTCTPQDQPQVVIAAMRAGRFRHMPVVEDSKLIGIVSSTDILKFLTDHLSSEEHEQIWTRSLWV